MLRFTSLSIRTQLLLIVLIVAIPAAVFIIVSGIRDRERSWKDAEQETQKLAAIIAAEQRYRVAAAEQLLRTVAQLPDVRAHRADQVRRLLIELHRLDTHYSNIFVADLSGRVWASSLPSKDVSIADRRYFRNAITHQRFSSGEYIVSKFTNKLVIPFAYPFTNAEGDIAGIVVLGFDLDAYRQLLSSEELKRGKSYLLLDYRGIVLARPINPEAFVGKPYNAVQFERMQRGPDEDTVIEQGMDGRRRLITWRKLQLASEPIPYMYIRAAIPVESVVAPANRQILENAGLFTLFLVLALALAWIIGKRSIIDPVALLEGASRRMADGNLDVRVSGSLAGGELASLGRSFDHMAGQLITRDVERTKLIGELQQALADIRTLQGILPICSKCKKIRNEDGDWTQLEAYISDHTNAEFSHGLCAECAKQIYGDYLGKKE